MSRSKPPLVGFEMVASLVNQLGPQLQRRSDDQLRTLTGVLRKRTRAGEGLDSLLPEAFALVREAANRTIGQRHFDVQVMAGAALHAGVIAEIRACRRVTL
jgi:preprotein translocase subunit SecA